MKKTTEELNAEDVQEFFGQVPGELSRRTLYMQSRLDVTNSNEVLYYNNRKEIDSILSDGITKLNIDKFCELYFSNLNLNGPDDLDLMVVNLLGDGFNHLRNIFNATTPYASFREFGLIDAIIRMKEGLSLKLNSGKLSREECIYIDIKLNIEIEDLLSKESGRHVSKEIIKDVVTFEKVLNYNPPH